MNEALETSTLNSHPLDNISSPEQLFPELFEEFLKIVDKFEEIKKLAKKYQLDENNIIAGEILNKLKQFTKDIDPWYLTKYLPIIRSYIYVYLDNNDFCERNYNSLKITLDILLKSPRRLSEPEQVHNIINKKK